MNITNKTNLCFSQFNRSPWPANPRDDGCVIEGTLVLLENGKQKLIEEIVPASKEGQGDILISSNGSSVFPVAMVRGPERNFPIVQLTLDKGESAFKVAASKTHVFLRPESRLVLADSIEAGDRLVTSEGVATVSSVEFIQYKGDVWNVILADNIVSNKVINGDISLELLVSLASASLLGLSPNEQLILTNGVVSGALALQLMVEGYVHTGFSLSNFN